MTSHWNRAGPRFRSHRFVFLLAFFAYLPGFWWGAPHATAEDRRKAWGMDDEPPLGPLAQLKDLLTPGLAPDANLGYPMLHSFLVLGAYAPYMGYLLATGKLASPGETYPYGFSDPVGAVRNLSWIAHLLSVVLGAGVVLAAFVTARTLWGQRAGWWAAVMVLLSFPMFYYARTSNVDVPALFFAAWSIAVLARILASGVTLRRIAALGALAGLAVATKEQMAALYLAIPLIVVLPHGSWKGFRNPAALAWAAAVGTGSAALAYALASGMILDPVRWKAHVDFALLRTTNAVLGSLNPYPSTLEGNWGLTREMAGRLRDTLTLPGLALAVTGVLFALRQRSRSIWLLGMPATYLLTLFAVVRATQLRYVMPAGFVLALFAGFAAATALGSERRPVRWAAAGASAAVVFIASLWAIDLTHAMLRDSRYVAGRWIADSSRPGDRLEYFGAFQKNPPLPGYLESGLAIAYHGGDVEAPRDAATVEQIRAGWRERQPRFIVIIPDHTSRPGEPFPHSCPPQIFDDLEHGRLGYVRAEFVQTTPLFDLIRRPRLDYGAVNPEVRIYVRSDDPALARTRS